jgi:hypothetical protein
MDHHWRSERSKAPEDDILLLFAYTGCVTRGTFSGLPHAWVEQQKPATPIANHPWRQEYRKMRPWSKPGQVPLIHEMSGGDRP